jgi:cysteine desulfurase
VDAPVYLDHQASAPLDPRVLDAMLPWLRGAVGNPHAAHPPGWRAAEAVERARAQVAALMGVNPLEVVFTSGATEAANLAVKGAARAARAAGRDRLVATAIEHPAVLACCRRLEAEGFGLDVLPVGPGGVLDPDALARALTGRTALVSVAAASGDLGTIQPIAEAAALCRAVGARLHADAAQAFGRVRADLAAADLVSVGAHKVHGPPGIGALRVRRGTPVEPIMDGGGQERGLRPGTVPVALAVGFGAAAEIAGREMEAEALRLRALGDRLLGHLRAGFPALRRNGDPGRCLPGTLSLTFPGVEAEALTLAVPEVAVASGAACASGRGEPSPALVAIGLSAEEAACTIRVGLGRFTTEAEVDRAAALLCAAARRLAGGEAPGADP